MKKMLVLLDRPEDIEGHLSGLMGMVKTYGVNKLYLAKVSRTFGSRVRSIAPPHKLDMAATMSDIAASKYLSNIGDDLRMKGVETEYINPGIAISDLYFFVRKHGIDLIVTSDGRSGLCRWLGTSLTMSNALFLCEHVFGSTSAKEARVGSR